MIKVTILSKASFEALVPIEAWLKENFGPAVVKRSNKTYSRKKWSVRCVHDLKGYKIDIFVRDPAHATLIALRWL